MAFPEERLRRLRSSASLRRLVRENVLLPGSLIQPFFVREGKRIRQPIASMPGQFQFSPDELLRECEKIHSLGIGGIILFGVPDEKDEEASGAWAADGIVARAVRCIKEELPDLLVITDVCLCAYMSHGHCGVVSTNPKTQNPKPKSHLSGNMTENPSLSWTPIRDPKSQIPNPKSQIPKVRGEYLVDNDGTLELLARMAVAHARAGADMVAPSDMMDGRVGAIRKALDAEGFEMVSIMSYAAKYASALYGPFRDAAESSPLFGDRRTYQMDPANAREALREVALDIKEGADIVMVKPSLAYGDVIRRVREAFRVPVAAYSVSGEYAMVKAAAEKGWVDERAVVMEMLTGLRRAGADVILTYWAYEAARWLRQKSKN